VHMCCGPSGSHRPVCDVAPHARPRHGSSPKGTPPCRHATGATAHRAKLPPTGAAPAPVRDGASLRSVGSGCLRRCSATVGIMRPVYPEPAEGPPKTCRPAANHHGPPSPLFELRKGTPATPGTSCRRAHPPGLPPSPCGLRRDFAGDLWRTSRHDPCGPRRPGSGRQERASGGLVPRSESHARAGRRPGRASRMDPSTPDRYHSGPAPLWPTARGTYRFCVRKILMRIRLVGERSR
jgi:hypothetical protein